MLSAMSEYEPLEGRTHLNPPGFCIIPGCTSPSETSRRVLLGDDRDREIEVCLKHGEGDLDLEWLSELGD
jgi:hypothetical protein